MPAHLHTALLGLTILAVYIWLQIPALSDYSLQVFAVTALLYFVLKALARRKIWHIAPSKKSLEMAIATFALLLLVGSTGNIDSPLFALTYIHLFFLVFAAHESTIILIVPLLVLFHYAVSPTTWSTDLAELITLPVIAFFFLFTKRQHDEVMQDRAIIAAEDQELAQLQHQKIDIEELVRNDIQPHVSRLQQLAEYPEQNKANLTGGLMKVQLEIEALLAKLKR